MVRRVPAAGRAVGPYAHPQLVALGQYFAHRTHVQPHQPGGGERGDGLGILRRAAVARYGPQPRQVPQKAALLGQWPRRPDAAQVRPQRVEHRPPVDTLCRCRPQVPLEHRQHTRYGSFGGQFGIKARVGGQHRAVRGGPASVARHHGNGGAVPVLAQGQQHVHRRQPRADEQHGFVGTNAAQVAGYPGVGVVAGVLEVAQIGPCRRRGREIAQRQHHVVAHDFGPLGQLHGPAAIRPQGGGYGRGGVPLHGGQPGRGGQRGGQLLVQVAAVGRARGKIGHTGGTFGLAGQPLRKMTGLFGVQAQRPVAHVEQVFGPPGGVGQSRARHSARLDEVNFGLRQGGLFPQLQHQCRARKAAAHNGDNGTH